MNKPLDPATLKPGNAFRVRSGATFTVVSVNPLNELVVFRQSRLHPTVTKSFWWLTRMGATLEEETP